MREKIDDPDSQRARSLDARIAGHRESEPPLDIALVKYVKAWHRLSTCRGIGMGMMGPIPFTAIAVWADFHRLDYDEAILLETIICQLDNDHAERMASEAAQKRLLGT